MSVCPSICSFIYLSIHSSIYLLTSFNNDRDEGRDFIFIMQSGIIFLVGLSLKLITWSVMWSAVCTSWTDAEVVVDTVGVVIVGVIGVGGVGGRLGMYYFIISGLPWNKEPLTVYNGHIRKRVNENTCENILHAIRK